MIYPWTNLLLGPGRYIENRGGAAETAVESAVRGSGIGRQRVK